VNEFASRSGIHCAFFVTFCDLETRSMLKNCSDKHILPLQILIIDDDLHPIVIQGRKNALAKVGNIFLDQMDITANFHLTVSSHTRLKYGDPGNSKCPDLQLACANQLSLPLATKCSILRIPQCNLALSWSNFLTCMILLPSSA
jgi:hypothetical protein